MSRSYQIVVLDYQITNGSGGHVETQRLPVVAIVKGDVNGALCSGKEQPFALRVLFDDVYGFAVGDSVSNLRPALSRVACAIDVRAQVV